MTVFLILAICGVVLVVASLLFDGMLEALEFDSPLLSAVSVGGFLGGYGLAGIAMPESWAPISYFAAIVPGAAIAWGASWFTTLLKRSESNDVISGERLVGTTGHVVNPIRGSAFGEVMLDVAGHRIKYNAKSDEELAVGDPVAVVATITSTSVLVMRLP